jgi:hypothetical protein
MIRSFSLSKLAACLLAGFTLIPAATAEQPKTQHYTTNFEVSITKRANPLDSPYQVIGELSMNVAADGSFSCRITPLKDVAEIPVQPSVIFVGGKSDPNGPSQLPCSGQVTGRLIGITIDMGNGYQIYGTGVMPADISKLPPGPISTPFGGTASTSIAGEGGDWLTVCVSVTVGNTVVRVCASVTLTL